jgi:hypothetical protein
MRDKRAIQNSSIKHGSTLHWGRLMLQVFCWTH